MITQIKRSPKYPKPTRKYLDPDGVYRFPDGREVCNDESAKGREEYRIRTWIMALRQGHECAMCHNLFVPSLPPTFGHECSRGGGKQDDRLTHPDGTWRNAALCMECNGKQGSRRFSWQSGLYLPVKEEV